MDLGLNGKIIIVTGGAKGIGAGISKALTAEKSNTSSGWEKQRR